LLAFLNWLALSWTVAIACIQGLTRAHGTFLRTPKTDERNRLLAALWSARAETLWVLALWGAAAAAILNRRGTPFFLALLAWQGAVYAAAPYMSWLNQHTKLTPELESRRSSELRRERVTQVARYSAGSAATTAILVGVFSLIAVGGANPGHPHNPFTAAHTARRDLPMAPTAPPHPTNPNGTPQSTIAGGPQPIAANSRPGAARPGAPGGEPATTTPGSVPVATTTPTTPASTPPTTGPLPPTTTAPASVTTTTTPAPTSTTSLAPASTTAPFAP